MSIGGIPLRILELAIRSSKKPVLPTSNFTGPFSELVFCLHRFDTELETKIMTLEYMVVFYF